MFLRRPVAQPRSIIYITNPLHKNSSPPSKPSMYMIVQYAYSICDAWTCQMVLKAPSSLTTSARRLFRNQLMQRPRLCKRNMQKAKQKQKAINALAYAKPEQGIHRALYALDRHAPALQERACTLDSLLMFPPIVFCTRVGASYIHPPYWRW